MTFSFIHTADIHLGRPFSNIIDFSNDARIKELYKKAVEKSFINLIEYARTKNVDFVLIAGDTFDSDEQDFESKLILKEGLKKLESANIKVFLISGNHDPITSYNKNTFNFDEDSNIKIVGLNSKPYNDFVVKDANNNEIAIIHALSFTESTFKENPTQYFSKAQENLFNIGLLHCDLDAGKESPYAPCTKNDLDSLNYNYWALGHIHIPSDKYAGTIQGRNTKETGAHGIRHIKVENGVKAKDTFVPIDVIRFEDVDIDLSQTYDVTSAVMTIQENLQSVTNSCCELFFIRLNLTGYVNYYNEINTEFFDIISEKIKSDSFGKICISTINNNTVSKVNDTELNEDDGIAGQLYKTIQDEKNIDISFDKTEETLKQILNACNFSQEEYESFKKEVKNTTKETCKNLCSLVYNNESKEA